jgi:hypothetical protein
MLCTREKLSYLCVLMNKWVLYAMMQLSTSLVTTACSSTNDGVLTSLTKGALPSHDRCSCLYERGTDSIFFVCADEQVF